MKRLLDLETWARREHFAYFRTFTEPFFGITVDVRCDATWDAARSTGASFYLSYLHAALVAANAVESFAYRIDGDRVWHYDRVDVSATVGRLDGTFGFSYMPFNPSFQTFSAGARAEIDRVAALSGLSIPRVGAAVVHASALPWLQFTGLSHARDHTVADSSPKLCFGRVFARDGARWLPVAVHAHHALVDGLHVGQFVAHFQSALDRENVR